jgi:hypothetical protein
MNAHSAGAAEKEIIIPNNVQYLGFHMDLTRGQVHNGKKLTLWLTIFKGGGPH